MNKKILSGILILIIFVLTMAIAIFYFSDSHKINQNPYFDNKFEENRLSTKASQQPEENECTEGKIYESKLECNCLNKWFSRSFVPETGEPSFRYKCLSFDASQWNVYQNKKYGFEIKYKPNGQVRENSLDSISVPGVNISVSDKKYIKPTNKTKDVGPGPRSSQYIGEQEIAEGISADVFESYNHGERTMNFYVNNGEYTLNFGFGVAPYPDEDFAWEIMSTLKLLDKAEMDKYKPAAFKSDESGNYYGILTITGYPVIKVVTEPFCETDCKKYQYVFFQILSTDNEAVFDFIKDNSGNSFVGDKQIGLGCKQTFNLMYYNDSDQYKMKEYNLVDDASTKIFKATKYKPITIKLEKLSLTGGTEAPACYSHFTKVDVID